MIIYQILSSGGDNFKLGYLLQFSFNQTQFIHDFFHENKNALLSAVSPLPYRYLPALYDV